MYDKVKNTITFPHIIRGEVLNGKTYDKNCINGGNIVIAKLGLSPNSFFGGNVDKLGLVKELGFYACVNRWNNLLVGFYIHDPEMMTELGRKTFEEHVKGCKINYQPVVVKEMTEKERERWEELKEEAREKGLSAELIDYTSAEGLVNALATIEKGVNAKANPVVEAPVVAPVSKNPDIQTNVIGNKPPTF